MGTTPCSVPTACNMLCARAGPVVLLQGHAKAQLLLAGMLLKGLGTPRSPSEACYWLEQVPAAATEAVTAARAEVGASANAARYPVRVQMWLPGAQSRRRCGRGAQSRRRFGRGKPSPGADVARGCPVPAQMWQGEPSPGADVAAAAVGTSAKALSGGLCT